jgi:hypothetical protein
MAGHVYHRHEKDKRAITVNGIANSVYPQNSMDKLLNQLETSSEGCLPEC